MKKTFFPLLILFNSICFVCSCNTVSSSHAENDSSTLVKLETDFTIALMKTDSVTFEKLLAPDFVYTENEKSYSRNEMMSSLMSGIDTVESAHNEDMQVNLYGNTGVVTGWMIVKGRNKQGRFEHKYRFTDTWNKDTTWQLVAAQDYLML